MKKYFLITLFIFLCFALTLKAKAETIENKLAGRILLQVENNGEAWYVNPKDLKRYFLGKPNDAFLVMKKLGIGISNKNLSKIPIGVDFLIGKDSDGDGLSDNLEKTIGTNITKADSDGDGYTDKEELLNNYYPLGKGKLKIDNEFSKKQKGKILLQVESNGEAWYVNPKNYKRYYLGSPKNAFALMRKFGLGIKNSDLQKISQNKIITKSNKNTTKINNKSTTKISTTTSACFSHYDIPKMEKEIFKLINDQREAGGLKRLKWNDDIANVARKHSQNLAKENEQITGMNSICDLPMIHHEGSKFGLYNFNRLKNSGIYYFSMSGENIALVSGITSKNISNPSKIEIDRIQNCKNIRTNINNQFKTFLDKTNENEKIKYIEKKLAERKVVFNNMGTSTITEYIYQNQKSLDNNIVLGWMNSPPHKKNIMTADFNESGIGIAYVNGYIIATQSFIKRIDCGYENAKCCVEKGYYPYCYQPLQCIDNICQPSDNESNINL